MKVGTNAYFLLNHFWMLRVSYFYFFSSFYVSFELFICIFLSNLPCFLLLFLLRVLFVIGCTIRLIFLDFPHILCCLMCLFLELIHSDILCWLRISSILSLHFFQQKLLLGVLILVLFLFRYMFLCSCLCLSVFLLSFPLLVVLFSCLLVMMEFCCLIICFLLHKGFCLIRIRLAQLRLMMGHNLCCLFFVRLCFGLLSCMAFVHTNRYIVCIV